VDGVSDQGLATWAGNLPPQIKLARYVVQWDVMQGAGYPEELANLQQWYDYTVALQLTPELALGNYNCSDCSAPRVRAEYTAALEALFRSFPDIQVLEAWNEPNNTHYSSYLPPAAAAHLMNAAYAFCELHSCTAIAGDLLDSEPNMVEYERSYERDLTPADPGNWAIHPYHAVKYMTDSTMTSFRDALPNSATDRIWFTEVGAYYCEAGNTYGEGLQASQAGFLVDKLIPEFRPAHVFYYEIAAGDDAPPACNSEQDDTALYTASNPGGAVYARTAAHVIFSPTLFLTAGLEELFAG
jgi:Glycosyl hydrolase catalytic core